VLIDRIGRALETSVAGFGEYGWFAGKALLGLFRRPFEFGETIRQIRSLGAQSLPLILMSGLAVGAVMSMHTRSSLERFGAESMIPAALAIAIVKETGPLVTALLVSGRVGAGIGAQLGGMRVTEQIDALEAGAVDSFQYLVDTRLAACLVCLPALTVFFNAAAIAGGFLSETVISGMTAEYYYKVAFNSVELVDYVPSTIKTVVFGFVIATVSCFLGYTASGGAEGVGRASTRSVVFSSMSLITANVLLVKVISLLFSES
jgi:phospholipid/cholesterol/gamma-HCH transport system permease protein